MTDPRLPFERSFSASDELIVVEVGSPSASFTVHKSVLCSSSKFFQAREKREWSAGGASIKLPHHLPEAFNLYANWLYMCRLPTLRDQGHTHEQHDSEWKCLAAAYVLGEELLDTSFKDTVIDAMHAKVRSPSGITLLLRSADIVRTVYDGTPEFSVARSFFVNIFVSHASTADTILMSNWAPREFLIDVLVAMVRGRKIEPLTKFGGPPALSKCWYHSHGEDETCYLD